MTQISSPPSTPLAEGKPDALNELMARDPLDLKDLDIARIVESLRAKRVDWAKAESEGKTKAPKAAKPKVEKATGPAPSSIDDLGL